VSADDLKNGELRLSIKDVFSNNYEGLATGPVRHVPGSGWPYVAKVVSVMQSEK
jgi:hypothetical protein